MLVPPRVAAIVLCRYFGTGEEATKRGRRGVGHLARQRVIRARAGVSELETSFTSLARAPEGFTACPFDNGATLDAYFRYAREPTVLVSVQLRGCQFVSNGRASTVVLSNDFRARLRMLTKSAPTSSKPSCRPDVDKIRLGRHHSARPVAPTRRLIGITMCRYYGSAHDYLPVGVPNRSGQLGGRRVLRGAAAKDLASAIDSLSPYPEGRFRCIEETEASVYLTLSYRGGGRIPVVVHFTGCPRVSNGLHTKVYGLTRRLANRLKRLVPLD